MKKENRNILLAIIAVAVVTYLVCQWMKKDKASSYTKRQVRLKSNLRSVNCQCVDVGGVWHSCSDCADPACPCTAGGGGMA